jgi:protease
MKFDLLDSNQHEVEHQRHLLSMRDMCQLEHLQELAESGACSFKIEGRLKDVEYVKNVVSAYSKELNKIVNSHPDLYSRASYGKVDYAFEPDLRKTFNRGFTTYFLNGRQANIANFDTPKAMGEYVGKVKEIRGNSFNVSGTAAFENGDGLCFINDAHELEGFRINKAEGNRLYPLKLPKRLRPGTDLYRNNDVAFSRLLANVTAKRRLQLAMRFGATADGFYLCASSHEAEIKATANIVFEHQAARQSQRENIIKQLAKLGNTIFECQEIKIENHADEYFVPSSLLAELRRTAVNQLESQLKQAKQTSSETNVHTQPSSNVENIVPKAYKAHSYLYNISNHLSKQFYKAHGLTSVQPALELSASANPLVMQCRHCIRFALGFCEKRGGKRPTWDEPLFLRLGDGRRFRLEFDCKECQMNIYAE